MLGSPGLIKQYPVTDHICFNTGEELPPTLENFLIADQNVLRMRIAPHRQASSLAQLTQILLAFILHHDVKVDVAIEAGGAPRL